MANFSVEQTTWNRSRKDLVDVRTKVFINEQLVPPDLEWDGYDNDCWHVIARNDAGQCIGTGRLLYDGHIGRMAVLPEYRKQGVGSALLQHLQQIAIKQGIDTVFLDAQIGALDFYRKHGYSITSKEFMDAGIPHRTMEKKLGST